MRIIERYSHLNGWEHIKVHKPRVWDEIEEVIATIDAEEIRTKASKERGMREDALFAEPPQSTIQGRVLYSWLD